MNTQNFESIRKVDIRWNEYWSARELAPILEYKDWRNFIKVIEKGKKSCETAWQRVFEHFVDVTNPLIGWNGSVQMVSDFHLSRYACYLIAQNGDPRKEVIAFAQMYFASQTRKQEILEQYQEDAKRVHKRDEITEHNKKLMSTAANAGVENFAQFNNAGYQWLYGGLTQEKIHQKKKLKPNEKILDHMGYTELAANDFRISQTEEIIRRERVHSQQKSDQTHYHVGREIRQTIEKFGNTPPENLPPHEDVKKVKTRLKKIQKDLENLE